jgi:DNA-binding CsgD family transcriptional regulator
MPELIDMYRKLTSTKEFASMVRSTEPLRNYFNLNQLYYSKSFTSRSKQLFTSFGTNVSFGEHFYNDNDMIKYYAIFDKAAKSKSELLLFKCNREFDVPCSLAWESHKIDFVLNIYKHKLNVIETFGFGLGVRKPKATEHMIEKLPLLEKYISFFMVENKPLIEIASAYAVEVSPIPPKPSSPPAIEDGICRPHDRDKFLHQLGLSDIRLLTPRELELLEYLAKGYPSSYIGEQLFLSKRTVENYISTIKEKLNCHSKSRLIERAQDLLLAYSQYTTRCD